MNGAGHVSLNERNVAKRKARDKQALLAIGIRNVQSIGREVQKEAFKALKRGRAPGAMVGRLIRERMGPVLLNGMRAAHVGGMRRALMNTPKPVTLSLAGDPFSEAIAKSKKRALLTQAQMDGLAAMYTPQVSMVLETFEAHVNRKLMRVSTELLSEGVHISEAKIRLAHAFDELGMTPQNSFTLEGIFRTEMAKSYSAGAYAAEQDEAIQEILWGWKYVTVGDGRVRETHVGFDGTLLPVDDPFWDTSRPPNGWACRCETVQIFHKPKRIKRAKEVDVDGVKVMPKPDAGFGVNFGKALSV